MNRRLIEAAQVRFVIFASPKSGTTWMQRMLGAHPSVLCGESRPLGDYFDGRNPAAPYVTLERFVSILSRYHLPMMDAQHTASMRESLLWNLWDTIAATSLAEANRGGGTGQGDSRKSIYGEKITPPKGTASSVVQRLHSYDPDLRFIHLVRDGRDVVVSGIVHRLRLIADAESEPGNAAHAEKTRARRVLESGRFDESDLALAAEVWSQTVRAGLEGVRRFRNSMTLKYEKMLTNAPEAVARVLSMIGAATDYQMVDRCVNAGSFANLSGGREPGHEDRSSFFRKGVAGDWRNWFTPAQTDWFEERYGSLLAELGYERGTAGGSGGSR